MVRAFGAGRIDSEARARRNGNLASIPNPDQRLNFRIRGVVGVAQSPRRRRRRAGLSENPEHAELDGETVFATAAEAPRIPDLENMRTPVLILRGSLFAPFSSIAVDPRSRPKQARVPATRPIFFRFVESG